MMNPSGNQFSKEFFDLVKSIGETHSKQEEDRIITAEVQTLKCRLMEADISPCKMREYLVRAIYIEMLGHPAPFAYIHAVKLTQNKNLLCKRIGYLLCSLCLDPNHELLLLLINTIQKDLESSNYMEVDAALSSICKLLSEEMIPIVFPSIVRLLSHHPHELVRKKCCMALNAIFRFQPQLVIAEAKSAIRCALCDPDPSVMAASLHLLSALACQDAESYKDLVPSMVSILKQIIEHRIPRDYDYHRVPAPWIQVKLLSLLGILGEGDQQVSEHAQEVLIEVIQRAELGANAGYAIIYEAVITVTTIFPSSRLLDVAATVISRFVSSENHNLKFVGITGLAGIVRVHPSFAARPEHQLVVLDALEDADETLKRRTLDLLFRMTNPVNAAAVVQKLLYHLRLSVDKDFRRDLISKICRLADRFAPNHLWYVNTINETMKLGGDLVPSDTAHNLLRLVAEGPTGNDDEDLIFRQETVNIYIALCEQAETLPDSLLKVTVWILGEYGSLNTVKGYESMEALLNIITRCLNLKETEQTTKAWILSAVIKLSMRRLVLLTLNPHSSPVTHNGAQPEPSSAGDTQLRQYVWLPRPLRLLSIVKDILEIYAASISTYIEARCLEFYCFVMTPEPGTPFDSLELIKELFPFDGACEDVTVDENLSFLDSFANESFQKGGQRYNPSIRHRPLRDGVGNASAASYAPSEDIGGLPRSTTFLFPSAKKKNVSQTLKFTPYTSQTSAIVSSERSLPASTFKNTPPESPNSTSPPFLSDTKAATAPLESSSDVVFHVQGPRRWGPSGYQEPGFNPTNAAVAQDNFRSHTEKPSAVSLTEDGTDSFQNDITSRITAVRLAERQRAAEALFSGLTPSAEPSTTNAPPTSGSRFPPTETPETFLAKHNDAHTVSTFDAHEKHSAQAPSTMATDHFAQSSGKLPSDAGLPDLLDLNWGSDVVSEISMATNVTQLDVDKTTGQDELLNSILSTPTTSVDHSRIPSHSAADTTSGDPVVRLRPFYTTTQEVSALWPKLQCEKRGRLTTGHLFKNVDTLFRELQGLLGAEIVEVIGLEGILAGLSQNENNPHAPDESTITYIHAKLTPLASVDLIFRGNDMQLLDGLYHRCQEGLVTST